MTHPFKPHVFNSLGMVGSENPGMADIKSLSRDTQSPALDSRESGVLFFKRIGNYSIPTRALIYCSRS